MTKNKKIKLGLHRGMSNEVWEDTKYFGYQVSSLGRVRSTDRVIKAKDGRKWCKEGKILKAKPRPLYPRVTIGKAVYVYVHTLVAEAFCIRGKEGTQVNHIDGDKTNNCVSNLEWLSQGDNIRHAFDTGLCSTGNYSHASKLTWSKVLEIRELYSTGNTSYTKLADKFGVTKSNIGAIVLEKSWKRQEGLCRE